MKSTTFSNIEEVTDKITRNAGFKVKNFILKYASELFGEHFETFPTDKFYAVHGKEIIELNAKGIFVCWCPHGDKKFYMTPDGLYIFGLLDRGDGINPYEPIVHCEKEAYPVEYLIYVEAVVKAMRGACKK